jgi:predicted CXXCH cytochrome family protein
MKKLNLMMVLALSIMLIIATAGISQAAVQGPCSNCHTMHNSQDGAANTLDGGPVNDFLTVGSCLGCHGDGTLATGAPDVFGAEGVDMCAGGTFDDTQFPDNTYVHNVTDITWTGDHVEDLTVTPGLDAGEAGQLGTVLPSNLSCAGVTGCHGDHDATKTTSAEGIKGYHHGSTAYRYCQIGTGAGTPIDGIGSPDWEAGGATTTNHNVYVADKDDGISAFCAQCHGDFHNEAATTGDTGGSSPFDRHPTDNLLASATGWDLSRVTIDHNANPFAFLRSDITAQGLDYDTLYATTWTGTLDGLARVACVSCHRAHGSPYQDILRFSYATQQAGSTTVSTGCLGCHEKQRGI